MSDWEHAEWRKSRYSSGGEGNCVEVASSASVVGVRDTKDRAAGHLTVSASAWSAFLAKAAEH